jgi:hypothetical protein
MVEINRRCWENQTKQETKRESFPLGLKTGEQMNTAPTAREQFVTDYLLVTDNNQLAYTLHMQLAEGKSVSKMADKLKEDYENAISETVANLKKMQGGIQSSVIADLMAQLLLGWGTDVFDDIARHYIGLKTESEVA